MGDHRCQFASRALFGAVVSVFFYQRAWLSSPATLNMATLNMGLQLLIGAVVGATALIVGVILYVSRSDALLGDAAPSALIDSLERRIGEERLAWRALDLLHGAALVDGLQVHSVSGKAAAESAAAASGDDTGGATTPAGAAAAAAPTPAVPDDLRLSLIRRVVPLIYTACAVHVESSRVVSSAFALLTAIAPLEEADTAMNRALLSPDGLCILAYALRRHVADARAARCGALALGIAVNAACSTGFVHAMSAHPHQLVEPRPSPEDLRDAADVCLLACERHRGDRDVQLWALYGMLHLAAADDGDVVSAVGYGRAGARAEGAGHEGKAAPSVTGPIIIPIPGRAPLSPPSDASTLTPHAVIGTRPYTLCGYMGERGAVAAVVLAMHAFARDERIASVAILLLGVLVKSRADNWALLLRWGAFDAVRHAVMTHRSSEKVMEVGTALLSVDNKFRAMAGAPTLPLPAWPLPPPPACGRGEEVATTPCDAKADGRRDAPDASADPGPGPIVSPDRGAAALGAPQGAAPAPVALPTGGPGARAASGSKKAKAGGKGR